MRQRFMAVSSRGFIRNCCLALGLGASLCLFDVPAVNAAGYHILVAEGPDTSAEKFGARIQQSLAPDFNFDLKSTTGDDDTFRQVLGNPGNIGISHADIFDRYITEFPENANHLEYHGGIPACLLMAVSRTSGIQTFDDLLSRLRTVDGATKPTIDVGPAKNRAAATFSAFRHLVPGLKNALTEHRGGFRALSRVAAGQIDAAALVVYAPFTDQRIGTMVGSDKVKMLPLYSHDLGKLFNQPKSRYQARQITLGDSKLFGASESVLTTCTSLGVVANTAIDGGLSEALARVTLNGDLTKSQATFAATVEEGVAAATNRLTETWSWLEGVIGGAINDGWNWAAAPLDDAAPARHPAAYPSSAPSGGPPTETPPMMSVIRRGAGE